MKQLSGESDLSYRASFSFTEKAGVSGIRRRNINLSHEISEISKRIGQFPQLKKYNDFSVTAHPNPQSERPLEAFIQEAWVCHAVPEPEWSYPQEFAMVQTKLRICMYLSGLGPAFAATTVLVVTCLVQKPTISLFTTLKMEEAAFWRKRVRQKLSRFY